MERDSRFGPKQAKIPRPAMPLDKENRCLPRFGADPYCPRRGGRGSVYRIDAEGQPAVCREPSIGNLPITLTEKPVERAWIRNRTGPAVPADRRWESAEGNWTDVLRGREIVPLCRAGQGQASAASTQRDGRRAQRWEDSHSNTAGPAPAWAPPVLRRPQLLPALGG
jgi:hypothetical protein